MSHKKHFRPVLFILLILAITLSSIAPAGTYPALADPIPSNILDPDEVGWASVRNQTSSQFSETFKEKSKQGYMVIDIEVDEIDDVQRVGAVWQKNLDGRAWSEQRNLTMQEFADENNRLRIAGYRLIDQEVYMLDGLPYYAGVWIKNVEKLDWISYVDKGSEEFGELYKRYREAGYLMIDVDAYGWIGGILFYSAVWVKNVEGLDWVEWRDLSSDGFSDKFDEYRDKYRMIDVESYRVGGEQRYAGIWVENKNGRAWSELRDMTAKEFGDRWLRMRDAGYRLINYEAYFTDDGWRYAAIWRQNSDRPDWELKDPVNLYLDMMQSLFNIPGMSVAIIQNGEFVYLRGFGYADVDDEVIAHSRTVYRLASVSKAVAGALAMRLAELHLLELDIPTRSYVPSLPTFHTHTVAQTITNRSGIGHYDEYPDIEDEYATAFLAVQELEDVELVSTPGSMYNYSTHAYTFLGAAMEAAVEEPVGDIVSDYLTAPYNLNSLRMEDRSVPNKYRASLYDTVLGSNWEIGEDDQSWKVLGGGLESSAYDLARFGIKLINSQIVVSDTLRIRMWSDETPAANYGYGWNLGTQAGFQVVAKNGVNNGARSYLRMYPELGIVIAVLTNRKDGGHSPVQYGQFLGTLVLNNAISKPQASSLITDSQAAATDGVDLEEPDEEATDPALEMVPVVNPSVFPEPIDLQEWDDLPVNWHPVYLPLLNR